MVVMRRRPTSSISVAATLLVAAANILFLPFSKTNNAFVNAQNTNQFAQGCLQHILDKEDYKTSFEKRMCNSDDDDDSSSNAASSEKLCRSNSNSPLKYSEIRILPGNWEPSMFYAWIIQIILSEVLDVPTTIDAGKEGDCHLSFYDPDDSFCYPADVYNYDGFYEGNRVVDCTKTNKTCGNVIPDVWHGQLKKVNELVASKVADSKEGNGMMGKYFWAIPKFVVENDQSFLSHLGIRGEKNRRKLAETFKRPTTWLDYCRDVSETNCVDDENAPGGYPSEEEDGAAVYFKEDAYKGHFRYTERNNCTLNEDTCTGHFIDYGCNGSINTPSQLYWMDIALQSEGPLKPNNGYPFSQAVQIWHAAHANQEPVMMWYWSPDPLLTKFFGTSAEVYECRLPPMTSECAANQISNYDRCNGDLATRIGPPERACGYSVNPSFKLITSSLKSQTYTEPEASRSPAYEFLRSFSMDNLYTEDILKAWVIDGKKPREAVCEWVAENFDYLTKFVPWGYPRIVQPKDHNNAFTKSALGVSVVTIATILCTMSMTFLYRKKKVFVYARYDFILMLLSGLLLVSTASILYTFSPSGSLCIAEQWFLSVGNTLSIVPLLTKVAAVNKLIKSSMRMKRVKIDPQKLRGNVALAVVIIMIYMSIWTGVDPPKKETDLALDQEGGSLVEIHVKCASSSAVWYLVALGWDIVLIIATLSLAFQTRTSGQNSMNHKLLLYWSTPIPCTQYCV